jgi:hypothetical protein
MYEIKNIDVKISVVVIDVIKPDRGFFKSRTKMIERSGSSKQKTMAVRSTPMLRYS